MTLASPAIETAQERHRLRVRGLVQGVGFRPFVYRLATALGLAGEVRNGGAGVEIEVQGAPAALQQFAHRLTDEAPANARIDAIERQPLPLQPALTRFTIGASDNEALTTAAPALDTAPCADCLDELFTPGDRRYRYPFINCTHCGPRYTLTARLPYDRANTSMAPFTLCPACEREYHDPAARRFHAQPNACPACGPRLTLQIGDGTTDSDDALARTLDLLQQGAIVAVKGLGGLHLMCDARNGAAVRRLREGKQRREKPFALMVANTASAAELAQLSDEERALLQSPARPVVLLRKRPPCDEVLAGVAPGLAWLGVMLPYTPLHHLLFHEAAGRPMGSDWRDTPQPLRLLCTSANRHGEPLITDNGEAAAGLAGIADALLLHDREILARCDDSVVRASATSSATGASGVILIRRARGYAPASIRLARSGPAVLALGAQLKNTICLTRGAEAFLSPHIGDLDNAATRRAHEEGIARLEGLLATRAEIIACDLHPDLFSSQLAARLARERDLPLITVQHHHAHIAAVMAEQRLDGPLLGVALDGVGLGSDGTAWGGELLQVGGGDFLRLGHLTPLPLPGGDRAAREPWRMAAAALHALGRGGEIADRFADHPEAALLAELLDRGSHCPPTTSAGRLFDAAAALLGVSAIASYEGEAAMRLEGVAEGFETLTPMVDGYSLSGTTPLQLDFLPLLAHLAWETNRVRGAALFHATLIEGVSRWVEAASGQSGLREVVLAGGCFLNRLLSEGVAARLTTRGFTVHQARQAPPNDGGIALGQAWVAQQRGMP
ncbi:MAG: carbamoyltransferase HypF [Gammaproteobacteria bacterium]|nr:carbamoyltransferase HypF [Gammaproteobacteria bacterium]